jgi:hypothetical protein
MVLECGEERAVLLSVDVCSIPTERCNRFSKAIEQATGLCADKVFLCCTHTHTAPLTAYWTAAFPIEKEQVERYADFLESRLCDAVKLALDVKANHATGTDIMIFGPAVAEKFDLEFKPTDDIYEAIEAVRDGGRVMLRVSNRHACNKGIFTVSGHYMVMVSATKEEVCILDPNWSVKKYKKWADQGYVKMKDRFLYTTPEILHNEGIQGLPRYYIFRRK